MDVWADPATERVLTPATIITFIRTIACIVLVGLAINEGVPEDGEFWSPALKLLTIALVVYWAGDSLDGQVARRMHHETRIGAVLDIMSDRMCSAAFYFGLAWLHPEFTVAVLLYLAEFMVIDCFLSIAFLAWKIRSPNYFWVVDPTIYKLNWSHPAKAVNSALFAVMLLVTQAWWLGVIVAGALLIFKIAMLIRLFATVGLPIPGGTGLATTSEQASGA
ncbi:CDP-alcohol phosphatidyltransferase family protein [Nocardioides marmoriginsengisoli]|uniref:CDP-alcohol phosphatidyltransferase family protein n=1 Tax=Nocardioides marmoriginsengisoli TaxID=661483 RepID=A0A3N0CLB9_9ACTN|nr:CDP-alcohol phosphatidyltransferase family protein [Nocardioides marmoriginsengisoli]